jgi:hypothetical protein
VEKEGETSFVVDTTLSGGVVVRTAVVQRDDSDDVSTDDREDGVVSALEGVGSGGVSDWERYIEENNGTVKDCEDVSTIRELGKLGTTDIVVDASISEEIVVSDTGSLWLSLSTLEESSMLGDTLKKEPMSKLCDTLAKTKVVGTSDELTTCKVVSGNRLDKLSEMVESSTLVRIMVGLTNMVVSG